MTELDRLRAVAAAVEAYRRAVRPYESAIEAAFQGGGPPDDELNTLARALADPVLARREELFQALDRLAAG